MWSFVVTQKTERERMLLSREDHEEFNLNSCLHAGSLPTSAHETTCWASYSTWLILPTESTNLHGLILDPSPQFWQAQTRLASECNSNPAPMWWVEKSCGYSLKPAKPSEDQQQLQNQEQLLKICWIQTDFLGCSCMSLDMIQAF